MSGRECYHCRQWIEAGEAHDCWTTTEAALTADLSEDLRDAWERLREAMVELGEQRIYASGSCIMFSREVCHVFVRPKRKVLEICIFLPRALKDPRVRRADKSSKVKFANLVHIQHRDEVEAPLTEWLAEAYALQDVLAAGKVTARPPRATTRPSKTPAGKATRPAKPAKATKSQRR
jgi:hypothetical protein